MNNSKNTDQQKKLLKIGFNVTVRNYIQKDKNQIPCYTEIIF